MLRDFEVGYADGRYTFPEFDGCRRPVGVVYRHLTGEKKAAPGGKRGLPAPAADHRYDGPLYVAEGAPDAMALHMAGFRAVGRPAAVASLRVRLWLGHYVHRHAGGHVVVVGDDDPADRSGRRVGPEAALALARSFRTPTCNLRTVEWALPLEGYKDVREQLTAPAGRTDLRVMGVRS